MKHINYTQKVMGRRLSRPHKTNKKLVKKNYNKKNNDLKIATREYDGDCKNPSHHHKLAESI